MTNYKLMKFLHTQMNSRVIDLSGHGTFRNVTME